jgi:hypothetical protein
MSPHSIALAGSILLCGAAWAAEPEAEIKRVVIEDDQVRIEELRVRGQVQQVIVRHKRSAAPDYQIIIPEGGRDLSKDRRATGQRVWHILSF